MAIKKKKIHNNHVSWNFNLSLLKKRNEGNSKKEGYPKLFIFVYIEPDIWMEWKNANNKSTFNNNKKKFAIFHSNQ